MSEYIVQKALDDLHNKNMEDLVDLITREKECTRCKKSVSLDNFKLNKRTEELNKTCSPCLQKRKCQHGRLRSQCKESPCEGSGICQHGRRKDQCKDCEGSQICQHGRCKSYCKESPCRGSQICQHGRRKSTCSFCKGEKVVARIRSLNT